jgi:hypothetical protein
MNTPHWSDDRDSEIEARDEAAFVAAIHGRFLIRYRIRAIAFRQPRERVGAGSVCTTSGPCFLNPQNGVKDMKKPTTRNPLPSNSKLVAVKNATCEKCGKRLYFHTGQRLLVCRDPLCQPIPYKLTAKGGA